MPFCWTLVLRKTVDDWRGRRRINSACDNVYDLDEVDVRRGSVAPIPVVVREDHGAGNTQVHSIQARATRIRSIINRRSSLLAIGFAVLLAGCDSFDLSQVLVSGSPSIVDDGGAGGDASSRVCMRAPSVNAAGTLVVLDWTGGTSRHSMSEVLAGFDFDALNVTDFDTAAGMDADALRKVVLAKVESMLCALEPMDVAVIEGESDDHPEATIVHVSGDEPAGGGKQIGQSDYDPCNRYNDDAAIIWAGAMASRIDGATFDQWATALANAITHEIGHTLGFFHPSEADLARELPNNAAAEVMRKSTSITELLSEQAFLVEQDTCAGGDSYRLVVE